MLLTRPAPRTSLRELERFVEPFVGKPSWAFAAPELSTEFPGQPALDFSENGKEYVVRLEFPGVTRDDLDVSLDGNSLTISGKRELNRKEKGENFLWEERAEGRFSRTLRLPGAVQPEKIDASYGDGVLTVKLPKSDTAVKNRIAIK